MTGFLSAASSDALHAQEVLEPLFNIACHHLLPDSRVQPKLKVFYCRFMGWAQVIRSSPRREDALDKTLLQLLEGTCTTKPHYDDAFKQNLFPSLSRLANVWSDRNSNQQEKLKDALDAIDFHGGTPSNQSLLLTEMEIYSREGDTRLDTVRTTRWDEERVREQRQILSFGARTQASAVFRALDECRKACNCSSLAHDYKVRLALETHNLEEMATHPKFSLQILTSQEYCAWQEAYVDTGPLSSIMATHPDPIPANHSYTECERVERLCDLIKLFNDEQVQLPLKIDKSTLFYNSDSVGNRYNAAALNKPTSLQTLIESRGKLGDRLELVIAIKLAHAALHLEKGPWMKTAWDKRSIQFFQLFDRTVPPQPFFLTSISSEEPSRQNQRIGPFDHPDAGLLALGIMLLELRLGRPFESLVGLDQAGSNGARRRSLFINARIVHKNFEKYFSEDFNLAVTACLDRGFGGPLDSRLGDEDFMKRINDDIIAPLENEFAQFCRLNVLSKEFEAALQDERQGVLEMPPLVLESGQSQNPPLRLLSTSKELGDRASLSTPMNHQHPYTDSTYGSTENQACRNQSPSCFHDETPKNEFTIKQCRDADNFIQRQRDAYSNRIRSVDDEEKILEKEDRSKSRSQILNNLKFPDPGYRIRIAVLDTGIHLQHSFIDDDRIMDMRSWLDGAEGNQLQDGGDENGHGTHVAHLILQVAPDCNLYIAQIARQDVPENSLQISKAIMHAVDEWKVDIITMSFGMSREDEVGGDELQHAFQAADRAGILLFAAASNGGGSVHRAFPARHNLVFCVYGTDAFGNSCPYNPTAERAELNLATLGDAVKAAWPYKVGLSDALLIRKSGTSFSTPIAAAFAAVVLLYARQRLPEKAAAFKCHYRMKEVFKRVSRSFGERGGYNFVTLDMILKEDHQYIENDLRRIADYY